MQKQSKTVLLVTTSLLTIGIITMAFQDSSNHHLQIQSPAITDTVPDKHITIDVNVDDVMRDVEKQLINVDKTLKEIEWDKMSKEIEASLKSIDLDKIRTEVSASLDKVDMEKIKKEIDRSVRAINTEKINEEIKKAMEEVKANLNSPEFKKNMEEVKKINTEKLEEELRKAKTELEKNKVDMKLEMKKAKEQIAKAKANLSEYKEMTSQMRKDGLISNDGPYDLQYKNNELFINGKKQSPEITNKYRKYFKEGSFEFKKNKEGSNREAY